MASIIYTHELTDSEHIFIMGALGAARDVYVSLSTPDGDDGPAAKRLREQFKRQVAECDRLVELFNEYDKVTLRRAE